LIKMVSSHDPPSQRPRLVSSSTVTLVAQQDQNAVTWAWLVLAVDELSSD